MKGQSYTPKNAPFTQDLFPLFEQFLQIRQLPHDPKPLCPKTVRSYRQAFGVFASPLMDTHNERDLRVAVNLVIDGRLSSGKMTPSGMNAYLRALNSFFSWCEELEYLPGRIKIDLLRTEKRKRPRTLGQDQIGDWQQFNPASFSQVRAVNMVLFVLDTGLRAEECLGLQGHDLDLKAHRIWVAHGKGGGNREVPLSTEGQKALKRFLATTASCRGPEKGSYIFCTRDGDKLNYRNALRDLKSVAKRLGSPWVGWHTFRRTFGTLYVRSGGLLTDLQQIYGHTDARTTLLYLGNSIEEIVSIHNDHSPLSLSHKHKRKKLSASPNTRLSSVGLVGRSRQR